MKHLKLFERFDQIFTSEKARETLSLIYDIKDEVNLSPGSSSGFLDFLVDVDVFIKYANEHNGNFAGNQFELDEFKYMIEFELDDISPIIYVAPFWLSRTREDLVEFKDVYSDTIYIKLVSTISTEEIKKIKKKVKAHECDVFEGESGNNYLRIWWD